MLLKTNSFLSHLKKNKYIYGLQLLLAITMMVDYATGININHSLGNWFYVLPLASMALINAPMMAEWQFYKSKHIILAVYYLLIGVFLLFLTPVFGPYFQLLILLVFATAFWYSWRGLLVSLILEFVLITTAIWHQQGQFNSPLWFAIIIRMVILAVIGILFTWASHHSDQVAGSTDELSLRETVSFERTRLLSLINSMADAVLATNGRGQIVLYNGAALDLMNTNVALENKYLQAVLPLFDEESTQVDIIAEAQKANKVLRRDDLHFTSNEDQDVDVYASISPIRSGFTEKGDQGFIVVLRDITKQKTLDEERDEFVSVTSHELRTPIAIVEANISTALLPNVAGNLDPKAKELLEQAHHNIVFLGDLVNDLTMVARAERNDLEIQLNLINPLEELQKLLHDYTAEAKTRGLSLTLDPKAVAQPINNSELYVHEILQNFVTNALKYTEKGGITMSVKSTADGSAIFSVSDTGIGISAQDKKKVFGKFYRAEDYRTRKTRGTGLGLYITLKLVQRIKGQIWFDSQLNKGSTFYLQVPSIKPKQTESKQPEPVAAAKPPDTVKPIAPAPVKQLDGPVPPKS